MEMSIVLLTRVLMISIDSVVVFSTLIMMLFYLRRFSKNKKYVAMKMYLDKNVKKSFLILSISSMIFSFGIVTELLTFYLEFYPALIISEFCYLVFCVSLLNLSYTLLKSSE
ncbi:MAG: hypothetical protein QXT34_02560 [Candidatus Aenigmatarchaeota archaeon]